MCLTHGDGNCGRKEILFSYRKASYSFILLAKQGRIVTSLQLLFLHSKIY